MRCTLTHFITHGRIFRRQQCCVKPAKGIMQLDTPGPYTSNQGVQSSYVVLAHQVFKLEQNMWSRVVQTFVAPGRFSEHSMRSRDCACIETTQIAQASSGRSTENLRVTIEIQNPQSQFLLLGFKMQQAVLSSHIKRITEFKLKSL